MAFKGKAPGSGSGEMSRRTQLLRPVIALSAKQVSEARRMHRAGAEPDAIAEAMAADHEGAHRSGATLADDGPGAG